MLPNSALASVELVIPGDQFIDAMRDIAEWLADAQVTSPYATCRRNPAGNMNVCIGFPAANEAAHFAASFGHRFAA